MSYLGISEAAWSLVFSKDPRMQSQPQLTRSGRSSDNSDSGAGARSSILGQNKQTSADHTAHGQLTTADTQGGQLQQQVQQDDRNKIAARRGAAELPHDLQLGWKQAATGGGAARSWSPCSAESPGSWLTATHGPAWQAHSAAAAREAAAAHKQLLGQLEQRRAALLKDVGRAHDLDLKALLRMITSYADEVQGLLSTSQASALQAQQDYVHDITGTAAAALTNSIQAALQEEHQKHQEQLHHLQQQHTAQLESARHSSKQQLAAAVQLHQQQAQQQLDSRLKETNDYWSARCCSAEAAAAKQEALRAHADNECNKLRTEVAAAKQEAAKWRMRWERDCSHSRAATPDGAVSGPVLKGVHATFDPLLYQSSRLSGDGGRH